MSIISVMRIAPGLRAGGSVRLFACLLAVIACGSWLSARAIADELATSHAKPTHVAGLSTTTKPTVVTAAKASVEAAHHDGNVFCNGIRLQDEIELVNTRNLCGCSDPETLRSGLTVENYAVTGETGC